MSISFYSQLYDRYLEAHNIEELPLNEVYLVIDELQSHKEVLEKQWRRLSKKAQESQEDLIDNMKAVNTLFIIAKRRAHYLNHAKVKQLTTAVIIWKKRAFLLGKQLNMTQDQVKEIQVYAKES
jgi:ribosome-binding ATPase YchF (GTP1/OBG family)